MMMATKHFLLRPWQDSDAKELYTAVKIRSADFPKGWPSSDYVPGRLGFPDPDFADDLIWAVSDDRKIPNGFVRLRLPDGTVSLWLADSGEVDRMVPELLTVVMKYSREELGLDCLWYETVDTDTDRSRILMAAGFRPHHWKNLYSPDMQKMQKILIWKTEL